jgi:Cof subfamily protein (haloacid dehalogenase superfamily)
VSFVVILIVTNARITPVKPSIRLVAVDIDGTLLDSNFQITQPNLKALRTAHHAGVEIVLVTGRRHTFALPVAQELGFDLCLISSNGAITKSIGGELFHRDLLPAAAARRFCSVMDKFRKNIVLTFDREDKGALVMEGVEELTLSIRRWVEKNRDYIEFVQPAEAALTTDPVQAMVCGPIARMQVAEATLAESNLLSHVTVLKTQYDHRDLCILDVLNQGCSKGHALERWARHRGVKRQEIMAIGDNFNDVEMLEFAGNPVIMGNACEQLKRNGYKLTCSNDESGVARALSEVMDLKS